MGAPSIHEGAACAVLGWYEKLPKMLKKLQKESQKETSRRDSGLW